MPFHVYILQNIKTGRKYYGICANLEKRILHHNKGKVKSTKAYLPYRLLYSDDYSTRGEAFIREKFFKTLDGYNYLKNLGII